MCVCVYKAKRRSCFGASFKTYSNCSDDRLSFSLSLRFNLNAQICNGYNGKRGFCWCKKREKRTTLLCEKETRLQLESLISQNALSDFSLFLSFSLTFSLSLFHPPLRCSFIFVSSERARCAVEADTINEGFYSRTFSVIIDDEIIWKKKKKKL